METIASASKELHKYERAGGFAPTVVAEAADAALEAPTVSMELAASASAPPPTSENREASLPQSVEATKTTTTVTTNGATEAVVREAGSSPPRPVTAGADEVRVLDEPTTTVKERVALETMTRAASPEIQDAEETGASLSQGTASGEVQALELACTPWAATFGSGDDIEDDEEVAARNTLEHGLNWARRAFDELILPATSVSSLVRRSCPQFFGLLEVRHLSLLRWRQTLESSGWRRAREVRELRAEWTQLEMQLVVARVAAVVAVASEASARTSLEAAHQSAEDHATTAETAAATAATERDSLTSRLALTEAEVEKLRAAAASAEEAAAAATETTARDAAQIAAREKVALEARVSKLERDLGTTTSDLATTGRQFSQVTNQLQMATEEATRLCDANAKLSQDLDGKLDGPLLSLSSFPLAPCRTLTRWTWLQGCA
jgi:hypothetical protein